MNHRKRTLEILREISLQSISGAQRVRLPCFDTLSSYQISDYFQTRIRKVQQRNPCFRHIFSDNYYAVVGGDYGIQLVSGSYCLDFKITIPSRSLVNFIVLDSCNVPKYHTHLFTQECERVFDEMIERAYKSFLRYKNYLDNLEDLQSVAPEVLLYLYVSTKNAYEYAKLRHGVDPCDFTYQLRKEQGRAFAAICNAVQKRNEKT